MGEFNLVNRNYKFCIDCWAPLGEEGVDFYTEDTRSWQDTTRCKKCLKHYVSEFKKKYPNTKTKHRYRKLTKEQEEEYKKYIALRRAFDV